MPTFPSEQFNSHAHLFFGAVLLPRPPLLQSSLIPRLALCSQPSDWHTCRSSHAHLLLLTELRAGMEPVFCLHRRGHLLLLCAGADNSSNSTITIATTQAQQGPGDHRPYSARCSQAGDSDTEKKKGCVNAGRLTAV